MHYVWTFAVRVPETLHFSFHLFAFLVIPTFDRASLASTCLYSLGLTRCCFLNWRQVSALDLRCVFRFLSRFHNREQIHIDLIISLSAASIAGQMDLLARRRADLLEFVYRLWHCFAIICNGDSFLRLEILLNICQPRVVLLSEAILTSRSRDYISESLILFNSQVYRNFLIFLEQSLLSVRCDGHQCWC